MNDKSTLLEQLRIDRTDTRARAGGRRRWIISIGVAVLLLAAGGIWMLALGREGVPVHAATAKAIASAGGTVSGGSLLDASGYVVAMRQATVSSQIVDRVDDVPIEAGERVKKGQILARLDDSQLRATLGQSEAQVAQARAALAAARLAAADANPIYLRDKKQLAEQLISQDAFDVEQQTYDALQTAVTVNEQSLAAAQAAVVVAQRNMDYTIVRAPFDGVVTGKSAYPGQIVSFSFSGGGGIVTIVDMDSLEVDVDVSENFISRVHADQPATITLNAYPDWQIPGSVIAIIPTADQTKATVTVRVGFKQKDARILPQMGARVSFLDETPQGHTAVGPTNPAVMVPPEAVQGDGASAAVWVVDGNTVARRAVRLGSRSADGQTILSGLEAGAQVVLGDASKLSDGTRVHVVE